MMSVVREYKGDVLDGGQAPPLKSFAPRISGLSDFFVFNQESKMLLMQSFIMSHFLYCGVVYHYCSRSEIIKLEKNQKKGLKFVYKDFQSSYTTLGE